jgi:DNA-binding transcriptional ArsR family regulator
MMEASEALLDKSGRRKRYERYPEHGKRVSLTAGKVQALQYIAEMRVLSISQIARLIDYPEKTVRRYMRDLFDAGLVEVIAVSRLALAGIETANDLTLIYGSAPNLYIVTKTGKKLLFEAERISETVLGQSIPTYTPKNSFYLAHELAVKNIYVWLEETRRLLGSKIHQWRESGEAHISLPNSQEMQSVNRVKPDAWFTLGITDTSSLTAFVEVDRGTERGLTRWEEKVRSYHALFATQDYIKTITGQSRARILVTVPDENRRDRLAEQIQQLGDKSGIQEYFWLIVASELTAEALVKPVWRQTGQPDLVPLITNLSLPNTNLITTKETKKHAR